MVANEKANKIKRSIVGEVVSDKMDKTIVIKVQRTFRHPMLQKVMKSFKKYKVHDENEVAQIGDIVEVYEGRPLSKTKHLYLERVVKQRAG